MEEVGDKRNEDDEPEDGEQHRVASLALQLSYESYGVTSSGGLHLWDVRLFKRLASQSHHKPIWAARDSGPAGPASVAMPLAHIAERPQYFDSLLVELRRPRLMGHFVRASVCKLATKHAEDLGHVTREVASFKRISFEVVELFAAFREWIRRLNVQGAQVPDVLPAVGAERH